MSEETKVALFEELTSEELEVISGAGWGDIDIDQDDVSVGGSGGSGGVFGGDGGDASTVK